MISIFRLLALLLPRRVRARHLAALVRTFETNVAAARRTGGWRGAAAAALREYIDVVRSALDARVGGDPLAVHGSRTDPPRPSRLIEAFVNDLRFGLRLLVRQPVFSAAAVLTLALGIGANVAVFSVVWHVLLAPAPYRDAQALVVPTMTGPTTQRGRFSPLDLRDLEDRTATLASVAGYYRLTENLTGTDTPERLTGYAVTPGFFDILGVAPAAGRWFTPEESSARVVVLSHGLWQRRFGGDASAIGRDIFLNNVPTRIVGVMPPKAELPEDGTYWTPVVWDGDEFEPNQRGAHYLQAIARLRPGESVESARADADRIGTSLAEEYERTNHNSSMTVTGLREYQVEGVRPSIVALTAGVVLVLLMACGNLANLLLTRGLARAGEVAVRASLGASRRRLVAQLIVEGFVLSAAGGLVAVVLAAWGVRAILQLVPSGLPRLQYVEINLPVLVFLLGLTMVTALVFGLVPAWRASRVDLARMTREGGTRSVTGGRGVRRTLAVAQVAVAVTLVAAAGLLARTIGELAAIDPGFNAENVLTFNVTLPDARYEDASARSLLLTRITDRLHAVPGVRQAAFGYGVPYGSYNAYTSFSIDGIETPPGTDFMANLRMVGPGYFETLGIPLKAGRPFTADERAEAPLVAILSEEAARRYFGGADPVGRRIQVHVRMASGAPRGDITVVGVASDLRARSLTDDAPAEIYQPYAQHAVSSTTFAVRTEGDPMAALPAVRAALAEIDPDLALSQTRSLESLIAGSIARQRLAATLLGLFAGLAVVLAAVGLYGVFSVGVAQRTREIGIRMALGADRGRVLSLFIREGLLLTLIGSVLGLAGALAASRLVESLLVGVSPRDPITLAAATLTLLLVSVAASYLPARRASRTNAADVLQAS